MIFLDGLSAHIIKLKTIKHFQCFSMSIFLKTFLLGLLVKKKKNEPMIIYLSNIDYFLKNEKICFSLSISVNAHISF